MSVRPKNLHYRALAGVVDTYVGSVESTQRSQLQKFIERTIRWSNDNAEVNPRSRGYRLLDSFMSDAISSENLELVLEKKDVDPVCILLAHPASDFASIRAKVTGERTPEENAKEGLLSIARALGINVDSLHRKRLTDVLEVIQGKAKGSKLEIRFYNHAPGSPLYFFNDLVLVGRFGASSTSADLRWEMIVDDPSVDNDVYDSLLLEFNRLWDESSPQCHLANE